MEQIGQILNKSSMMKESELELKICDKCGDPVQKKINLMGRERIVPIMCRCKKIEMEIKKEQEENAEKQERLKRLLKNSLMDKKFEHETFENWNDDVGSKQIKEIGKRYCKNFQEAKKNGLGLLIYGPPGNGKTYVSNCIANNLLSNGIPVICVSINSLLERIRQTYSKWGKEGEDEILKGLSNADLLIIDDLGTEQKTDWSCTKIYNIVDSRYRNGLPLIVSTNKSIDELKEQYHERTIDRLLEMCTPLKNNNTSIRKDKARKNTDILRKIIGGTK